MKVLQNVSRSVVLAPVTAATTARTAAIDTLHADFASIVFSIGAELNTNSTNVAINLRESDVNAATAFTTFNSATAVTVDNTSAAIRTINVDLKGRKRFLQVVVTPDTTTNGPVITSVVSELLTDTSVPASSAIINV